MWGKLQEKHDAFEEQHICECVALVARQSCLFSLGGSSSSIPVLLVVALEKDRSEYTISLIVPTDQVQDLLVDPRSHGKARHIARNPGFFLGTSLLR